MGYSHETIRLTPISISQRNMIKQWDTMCSTMTVSHLLWCRGTCSKR